MDYQYVADDKKTGKRVTAVAAAESMNHLVKRLHADGLLPLSAAEHKPGHPLLASFILSWKNRVSGKEVSVFTRQLAAMLTGGLLLSEALGTIAEDMENEYFRKMIQKIVEDVRDGADFSKALSRYPKVFPLTYTAIIGSGEATGRLDKTLTSLARYIENSERLKEKVKSAIRYPLFVASFAFFVVMVIVFFIIPKFAGMFSHAGAKLPLLTRIVVSISQFCLHSFPVLLLAVIALGGLFWYGLKFPQFRFFLDKLKLKVPVLGKEIIHKAIISRFCRTLGFLIGGGVILAKAFEITSQAINHLPLQEAVERTRLNVVSGETISNALRSQKIFPRLVSKMVAVGERTGRLDEMFDKTADYYDDELEISLQNLTSLIEPVLIIFVGGMVLIVVLALYLPIFNLATAIR